MYHHLKLRSDFIVWEGTIELWDNIHFIHIILFIHFTTISWEERCLKVHVHVYLADINFVIFKYNSDFASGICEYLLKGDFVLVWGISLHFFVLFWLWRLILLLSLSLRKPRKNIQIFKTCSRIAFSPSVKTSFSSPWLSWNVTRFRKWFYPDAIYKVCKMKLPLRFCIELEPPILL